MQKSYSTFVLKKMSVSRELFALKRVHLHRVTTSIKPLKLE